MTNHDLEPYTQTWSSNEARIDLRCTETDWEVKLTLRAQKLALHFTCESWTAAEQLAEWIADAHLTVKEAA